MKLRRPWVLAGVVAVLALSIPAIAASAAPPEQPQPPPDDYTAEERADGAGAPPPFQITTPSARSNGGGNDPTTAATYSDSPTLSGPPWFNFQHDGSLVPQPPGLDTNTCWRRPVPRTSYTHWHCRLLYYGDYVIAYGDPAIKGVSEPSSPHRTQTGAIERTGVARHEHGTTVR